MLASAQDAAQRTRIYESLAQRNRLVAILRIGVPVLGAIVLAGLIVQLTLAALLDEFGISGIRIDRDNLVVETPSYSSMTADGTMYAISSAGARAALGDTDLLHLTDADLMVTKPGGAWMTARAGEAEMRLSSQSVEVPGTLVVGDSRGTDGTIDDVAVSLVTESMVSQGPASIRYYNGTTIEAESMAYDGGSQVWTFHRATLTVPNVPGAEPQTESDEASP